jgi:citrate lyase subunit beta/citryl-CoA lyase
MFAIHPRQLSAINEVFTPSPQEVEEAVLILQEAAAHGEGAFRWKGQMVDEAMLRRARRILERQEGRVRGGS